MARIPQLDQRLETISTVGLPDTPSFAVEPLGGRLTNSRQSMSRVRRFSGNYSAPIFLVNEMAIAVKAIIDGAPKRRAIDDRSGASSPHHFAIECGVYEKNFQIVKRLDFLPQGSVTAVHVVTV